MRGAGSRRDPVAGPGQTGALLAVIERRLADAAAGSAGLLFVPGEAGIGKTRLLAAGSSISTIVQEPRTGAEGTVRATCTCGELREESPSYRTGSITW